MSARRRRRRNRTRLRRPPTSPPGGLGIQPRRVATILAVVCAASIALDVAFEHAGFWDGFVLILGAGLCAVATPRAIGLWRGTVSHEEITYAPVGTRMSLDAVRAFTPCAIIAMDGLMVSFAASITTGGEGAVAAWVMFSGGSIAIVFILAGFWAAVFKWPPLLLPRTMR